MTSFDPDGWYTDEELGDASDEDERWQLERDRRRRVRLRIAAVVMVALLAFPILVTFVERVFR